jgi:hypothetical protein
VVGVIDMKPAVRAVYIAGKLDKNLSLLNAPPIACAVKRETNLGQFILFFDRRVWSSGDVVLEADSLEEAWQLYQDGALEDCLETVAWDDDDTEITLVDVEERKMPGAQSKTPPTFRGVGFK